MAATGGVTVHVRGMDALRRKLGDDLIAKPARNFLSRSGETVQGNSRAKAPVDRNRLRGSIKQEVDTAHVPLWVRIGPNVGIYDIAQEEGTKPFWPPKAPLEAWGARKGLTPSQVFMVRRRISQVGIKPKHYMRDGLEESLPKIVSFVSLMAKEIEARASA